MKTLVALACAGALALTLTPDVARAGGVEIAAEVEEAHASACAEAASQVANALACAIGQAAETCGEEDLAFGDEIIAAAWA